jgi:hypothetical protein
MKPRIGLTAALLDPAIFGGTFAKESFWTWRTVSKLVDGVPLDPGRETELFKACTGRTKLPDGPVKQLFLLVGRRGGKDRFMSAVGLWRSALVTDWHRHISVGEGATTLQLGSDKRQALIMRGYAQGLINASPLLSREVTRTTGDVVEFRNGGSPEIIANDVALVRGRSAVGLLGSETCFWGADSSTSSDEEVFAAAMPSLAMCPDQGIAILGSSVYRKRGLMWKRFRALWGNNDTTSICWLAPSRVMNPLLPEAVVTRRWPRIVPAPPPSSTACGARTWPTSSRSTR